jgi:hypothetical protein
MKKILLLAFIAVNFISLRAQWVSIPDTNFGTWLAGNGYAHCLQGDNITGWQLDTTCNALSATRALYINSVPIVKIYGLQYFKLLDTLDLQLLSIDSINFPLPSSIRQLRLDENHGLVHISSFPAAMEDFWLQFSSVSVLPPLPGAVTILFFNNNHLSSLPALPNSLKNLGVAEPGITSLPSLPPFLEDFGETGFNSLPVFPNCLRTLSCYDGAITTLPATLPDSLRSLAVHQNFSFTTIPSIPPLVNYLHCVATSLNALPSLPDGLKTLELGNSSLDSLPPLPNGLKTLECDGNRLQWLPQLPDSLLDLNCAMNIHINTIPSLPPRLRTLYVSYANIYCLPTLPSGLYRLDATGTYITCIPNRPTPYFQQLYGGSPNVDQLPLCDVFNNNGCSFYANIAGRCYLDRNNNCQYDSGDTSIVVKVNGNFGGVQQSVYSAMGSYGMVAPLGPYVVSVDTNAMPFTVCPDTLSYSGSLTALDSTDYDLPFAFSCKPGFDLAAQSVSGRFRPGGLRPVFVSAGDGANFYGVNCASGIGGTVQLVINGPVHYVSPLANALAPTTVVNDTLTWVIPDFAAVDFFNDFCFNAQTDTTAAIGTSVCFTLLVDPVAGDYNPGNNQLDICFAIVNSYDPNEKEVYPADNISPAHKELTYTIHFQNTGSAEAENIHVDDTLDANIDPRSFQLLAYSHRPAVLIDQNRVRFNFPNINLPDSNSNEPASHGYVQYKVRLKDNLPVGTLVKNTAYIYFDFNTTVVTNTTANSITQNADVKQPAGIIPQFAVFPNPASSQLNIQVDESLLGSKLSIYNMEGALVRVIQLQVVNNKLETASLASGLYIAEVKANTGVQRLKWIKM